MANRFKDPATGKFISKSEASTRGIEPVEKQARPSFAPLSELGVYGRRRVGKSLYDDFLSDLRGAKAVRVYREMADNDSTVSAVLHAIDMLIRGLTWTVEPFSDETVDVENATFVEECMQDMSHSWEDHISAALSMIAYGFSVHEIVYKIRGGPEQKNGQRRSRFNDGRLGWRKIVMRAQDSLMEWDFDETGGIEGVYQDTGQKRVYLPIEKLVLFRTTTARGNPEGRSLLRGAYTSWYYKKRLLELAAIGTERDLTGIPMAYVPAEVLLDKGSEYEAVKDMLLRLRQDEQAAVMFPSDRDETGNRLYEFDTISSAGVAKIQVLDFVRMLSTDIAGTVLADFLQLGRDAVGSRALAEPKQALFRAGLEAIADVISETHNRHVLPRLFRLNGLPVDRAPTLVHSEVAEADLGELGTFLRDSAQAGAPWFGYDEEVDRSTQDYLRMVIGMDPMPQEATVLPAVKRVKGRWVT